MDWTGSKFHFSENDLNLFRYGETEATVIQLVETNEITEVDAVGLKAPPTVENQPKVEKLTSAHDWDIWLNNNEQLISHPQGPGLLVIRAKNISEDEPSPLSYLPFARATFTKITKTLRIHRAVSRTVSREKSYFSYNTVAEPCSGDDSIVMTFRMSSSWPDDLAAAVTFFPELNFASAIVFGCSQTQRKQITRRLTTANPHNLKHPLLVPGILAELERKRLSEHVENTLDRFTLGTSATPVSTNQNSTALNMSEEQMWDYLQICYQSQTLAKDMEAVKRQLEKMVYFCGDFSSQRSESLLSSENSPMTLTNGGSSEFRRTNEDFRKRLLEIRDEYDDKIDECGMVLENLSITMQTVWSYIARHDAFINTKISRANTSIALDTKQENGQMKSIAVLTMIYLPISAVSSIFSMTMFNWQPQDGSTVSSYIWVFVVVAAILTILTLFVWQIVTYWQKRKVTENGEFDLGYPSRISPV